MLTTIAIGKSLDLSQRNAGLTSFSRLGGEVVANEVGAAGFKDAGFVNLTTGDCIVHGQVKQSGSFSFVRIYESGHEVPFYQPVAALEIFERAIGGMDIATGKQKAKNDYKTKGTPKSTYREGNGTVQFSVTDPLATYDTKTNKPGPLMAGVPPSSVQPSRKLPSLGQAGRTITRRRSSNKRN